MKISGVKKSTVRSNPELKNNEISGKYSGM